MILWDSISLHDILLFLNAATMQKRGAGNACSPQSVEKPGICVKHKPGFLCIAAKEG